MSDKTHGTYEKDGQKVVAESPAEAVSFEFSGWKKVAEKSAPAGRAS